MWQQVSSLQQQSPQHARCLSNAVDLKVQIFLQIYNSSTYLSTLSLYCCMQYDDNRNKYFPRPSLCLCLNLAQFISSPDNSFLLVVTGSYPRVKFVNPLNFKLIGIIQSVKRYGKIPVLSTIPREPPSYLCLWSFWIISFISVSHFLHDWDYYHYYFIAFSY